MVTKKMVKSIFILFFIAVQIFLIAATADCAEVIINDINRALSSSEKAALINLVGKQIQFHRSHSRLKTPVVLNIRLFSSDNAFLAYRNKNDSWCMSDSGYFVNARREIVVNRTKKKYFENLLHESQHLLFLLTGTKEIKWLNEGLSDFFDRAYVENGTVFIKSDETWVAYVKKNHAANKLTPLRKLVTISDKDWDAQFRANNYKYYAECWSLVFFLIMDNQSRKRHDLVYILRDLKKGSKLSTIAAINRRYPGGISALERDWRKFIASSNFSQKIKYSSR
jgi:hypothetical protein